MSDLVPPAHTKPPAPPPTGGSHHLRLLLDWLYPPHCVPCGRPLRGCATGICEDCWAGIEWIGEDRCCGCGAPVGRGLGPLSACVRCRDEPLPWLDAVVSAFRYSDTSHSLIKHFKFRGALQLRDTLGWILARRMRETHAVDVLREMVLVPVPLARADLRKRGFNQAQAIAEVAAEALGCACAPNLLRKTAGTLPQAVLERPQRRENLREAFAVNRRAARHWSGTGRRLVVVDDVITTGATMAGCARALRAVTGVRLEAASLARA